MFSGGAIRSTLPSPANLIRLTERPSSRQRSVTAEPKRSSGSRVSRSRTRSTPSISPTPRTSPTGSWRACSASSPARSRAPVVTARAARSSVSTVSSTARPTAAGSGSDTCEVTCRKPFSNASSSIAAVVTVADSGSPPPSVFDSVTKSGTTSCCSNANSVPDPAERGLRLVGDQQHAALVAQLREPGEVALGQRHDPAGAEDRLDDRRRARPDRLRVRERHARVQAGQVAAVAAVGDRAAVRVGGRERHRARQAGAVAAAPGAVGARLRARRHPVPRAREGQHLVPARVELGQPQRGLVGLAAGGEEHRPRERRRQHGHQLARQLGHVAREEAAEQVHGPVARLAHRGEQRRMPVAERGAHLARREVEDPAAVLGRQPAALRALHEEVRERAAVADQQVAAGAGIAPRGAGAGRGGHGSSS